MNSKEYEGILANANLKMTKNGINHKITEKCHLFSYVNDITAIKALKEIIIDIKAEVETLFDLYYIFTLTSKGNIRLPNNKIVYAHSVKINIWTDYAEANNPSELALTVNTPTDVMRDSFKAQMFNVMGELLKPYIFPKEAQRRKKEAEEKEKLPKSSLVMPDGKPLRA
ncbi:hypothetical protein CMI37_05190 [Candidatus Pacearchaeota archaeon]|jgi:hypothetical protein|nr:hypothetical protein [Candidatus Pacearchaeota archaeon]|tara:strand:+ start:2303 stop:2809 length:507 start_codon:yes stop_codon:yes gene_type:complete